MKKTKYNKFLVNRVGETNINNQGCLMEIVECFSSIDNTILFSDNKKTVVHNVAYKEFKSGSIKNYNLPSVFDIGYLGYGEYHPINNKKAYKTWKSMLARCYDKKSQLNSKNTSYINCSVSKDWLCFQIFAKWFEENHVDGWQIDKDILFKGNKIYSSETCIFVPAELNIAFSSIVKKRNSTIGIINYGEKFKSEIRCNNVRKYLGTFNTKEEAFESYKNEKENYIKELADKWNNLISEKTYKAMYNYKIEITD